MRVHILGSGTPDPHRDRYGSAFLFEVDDPNDLVMVDCGPASTWKMGRMGISPTRVGHLFLTHHHFDHNGDVPCFALTRWDQRGPASGEPLPVYGPPPTAAFMEKLFGEDGAYRPDIAARVEHPASRSLHAGRGGKLPRPAPSFAVRELADGDTVKHASWTAKAAWVHHVEPWLTSLAFRFETSHGSVVFTGDAGACPELDELCDGADVLVLCCAFRQRAGLDPSVTDCVTGVEDCARMLAKTSASTVVLTHSSRGVAPSPQRERAVAEIARDYDGKLYFGMEETTIDLG